MRLSHPDVSNRFLYIRQQRRLPHEIQDHDSGSLRTTLSACDVDRDPDPCPSALTAMSSSPVIQCLVNTRYPPVAFGPATEQSNIDSTLFASMPAQSSCATALWALGTKPSEQQVDGLNPAEGAGIRRGQAGCHTAADARCRGDGSHWHRTSRSPAPNSGSNSFPATGRTAAPLDRPVFW